jgi:hypothetical protein
MTEAPRKRVADGSTKKKRDVDATSAHVANIDAPLPLDDSGGAPTKRVAPDLLASASQSPPPPPPRANDVFHPPATLVSREEVAELRRIASGVKRTDSMAVSTAAAASLRTYTWTDTTGKYPYHVVSVVLARDAQHAVELILDGYARRESPRRPTAAQVIPEELFAARPLRVIDLAEH